MARSATMRTDHRIRVCNFVYRFRAQSCLLRAPVPCARVCGRSTQCLLTVWALVYRGCPCRRMASGTKRQLCAVLVLRRRGTCIRQSGTVELVICVLDCHEMSAPPLESAEWSAQSLRIIFSALISWNLLMQHCVLLSSPSSFPLSKTVSSPFCV